LKEPTNRSHSSTKFTIDDIPGNTHHMYVCVCVCVSVYVTYPPFACRYKVKVYSEFSSTKFTIHNIVNLVVLSEFSSTKFTIHDKFRI